MIGLWKVKWCISDQSRDRVLAEITKERKGKDARRFESGERR